MKCNTVLATLFVLAALPMGAMAADPQPADAAASPNDMPAPAAGNPSSAAPIFQQLDSNQDGYVSRDEAKRSADTAASFDDLDANRDGRISATEYGASSK